MTADDIIRLLDLKVVGEPGGKRPPEGTTRTLGEPHPEDGHFSETFRDSVAHDGRAASTAIYYLLRAGETSHWHRVNAAEVWHFYAGDPLELSLSIDGIAAERVVLGLDLARGERPQVVVPAGVWQSARPLGSYALAGCTVAPGFEFNGFEMAQAGWHPAQN